MSGTDSSPEGGGHGTGSQGSGHGPELMEFLPIRTMLSNIGFGFWVVLYGVGPNDPHGSLPTWDTL